MTRDQQSGATYRCTECSWTGDDYALLNDGTPGGTAVCPECEGQMTLNKPNGPS